MAKIPMKITVDLEAGRVFFDGEEFPVYVSAEVPIKTELFEPKNGPCSVTLTVLAETIEVISAKIPGAPEEVTAQIDDITAQINENLRKGAN